MRTVKPLAILALLALCGCETSKKRTNRCDPCFSMGPVAWLTIACSGCMGSPFESSLALPPIKPDAADETVSVMPEPRFPEAAPEAAADVAETATVDTGPSWDAVPEASCVISQPFPCGEYTATPPGQFCLFTFNGQTVWSGTPAECSTCNTYSCACIGPFAGCPHYSCTEDAGQVKVECK